MKNPAAAFMAASLLAHTAMGAGIYWRFYEGHRDVVVTDLNLTLSPLSAFGRAGGGKPSEDWFLPPKGKKAPPPPAPAAAAPAPTAEEVKAEEERACTGNNCTGEGKGSGGGVGEGNGVIDASDASTKPRWIRNMISSDDYPRLAKQGGKDGLVILQIILDETGRVRDVILLQGAYQPLNEVAIRKVQRAVFTPARGRDGRPVACRVTLPIRFELR